MKSLIYIYIYIYGYWGIRPPLLFEQFPLSTFTVIEREVKSSKVIVRILYVLFNKTIAFMKTIDESRKTRVETKAK